MGYIVLSVVMLAFLVCGIIIVVRARHMEARTRAWMEKASLRLGKAFARIVRWPNDDYVKFGQELARQNPWALTLNIWIFRLIGIMVALIASAGLAMMIVRWVGAS